MIIIRSASERRLPPQATKGVSDASDDRSTSTLGWEVA